MIGNHWKIIQGLDPLDFDAWRDAQGFVESLASGLWFVGYDTDERDTDECVAICFHSKRCAEIAAKFLIHNGISPAVFDALPSTEGVRREIIAALPW